MKFIDLFCGIGGFHLAFKGKAECVLACDWDEYAKKTYLLNFPDTNFLSDVSKINPKEIEDHDILCAGFPCQPFSIAGHKEGFSHPTQGTLFFDIIRIVKEKKPRVVFLENVKNILSHDSGKTFETIKKSLENEGYFFTSKILNACKYGNLPQNRERIFIVCFKNKYDFENFEFPQEIELTKKVSDIISEERQAGKFYSLKKEIIEGCKEQGPIYQFRRSYTRENKKGLCPTLTANMGTGGNNTPLIKDEFGVRKLTPRECLRFQGFPEYYKIPVMSDSMLYKQVGNSVAVPVVKRIADNILKAIKNSP